MNKRQRKKKFKKQFGDLVSGIKIKVKKGVLFTNDVMAMQVTYKFTKND